MARNDPMNVPDIAANDWPLRTPATAFPEQFFFLPSRTLDLALSYAAGTLTMDFTVGNPVPMTGSAWFVSQTSAALLESIGLAINDPPPHKPIGPVPVAQQGNIGVLASLATPSEGIVCSTWVTIDTGPAISP